MSGLSFLADQAVGSGEYGRPGVGVRLNDGGLRIDPTIAAPAVVLIGTTNNNIQGSDGEPYVIENEVINIIDPSIIDRILNNSSDGRPSELRLMYESAVNGGAQNIKIVATSKTVVTTEDDITATSTTIPVSTLFNSTGFDAVAIDGMPTPVWGAAACHVTSNTNPDKGWLVVAGGVNTAGTTVTAIQILNLETGEWSTGGTSLTTACAHAAFCTVNGASKTHLVLVGGSTYTTGTEAISGTSDIQIVSLVNTNSAPEVLPAYVVTKIDMATLHTRACLVYDPLPTTGALAFDGETVNGTLYLAGGHLATLGTEIDTIYTLDITTNALDGTLTDTTQNLSTAKAGLVGVYDNDVAGAEKIYFFGGEDGASVLDEVDVLPVPAGTAGTLADAGFVLTTPRAYAGVCKVAGSDRVFLIGGISTVTAFPNKGLLDTWEFLDLGAAVASRKFEAVQGQSFVNAAGDARYVAHAAVPTTTKAPLRKILCAGGVYNNTGAGEEALPYAEDEVFILNIGLGNLADTLVGFPDIFTSAIVDFVVQIDNEIMNVTAFTTARGKNGKEYDAFTVTRGYQGSTAVAHKAHTDITEGPEVLYTELIASYEALLGSTLDLVVVPWRATANCPYLTAGKNFAHALAYFCWTKSRESGMALGFISTKPAWDSPFVSATQTQINDWATELKNFSTTNHDSEDVWLIGDGYTDEDLDGTPDTYAFWATDDGNIPSGTPPLADIRIVRDQKDLPVDLGAYISVVAFDGDVFSNVHRDKFKGAATTYQAMGHVHYAGMVARMAPESSPTNKRIPGVNPTRKLSGTQVADLDRRRYVVAQVKDDGYKISTAWTFAHKVSDLSRSDFTSLTTMRIVKAAVDRIVAIGERYIGEPISSTRSALEVDLNEGLRALVPSALQGFRLTLTSTPEQEILGREIVTLEMVPQFERRNLIVSTSLLAPVVR